jgi:uncharacterized protein DUF4154
VLRGWRTLVLLALVLGARVAIADSVPTKSQALLLLRILAYDHNLGSRADGKTVTILIVSKAGNSDSDDVANELAGVIREIAKSTTLANNTIQIARLAFNEKTFDADVSRYKAAALYLAPGLGDGVGTIVATTQSRKLLSFTGTSDWVGLGVSVGFALDDGRPEILVNLPASRREGADLDAALLKAAKIVRR